MNHPLTEVIDEISTVRERVQAPWFRAKADKWLQVLTDRVTADLQTVDVLTRLDAKSDAIANAKHSLCETMGIASDTDMVEVLQTAKVTFESFLQLEAEHAKPA